MANDTPSYHDLLSKVGSDNLKKMANLWGNGKLRKEEAILYLQHALTDPQKIDATLERMQRSERAALGLLKLFGNSQTLEALSAAIRATGTLPDRADDDRNYGRDSTPASLLERGIVLTASGEQYYSYASNAHKVLTDGRILARVQSLEHTPLKLKPAQPPDAPIARRPQSLVLDVIAIVRAINDIGGIGFTQSGDMRVVDLRKFTRKMGWEERVDFDGLPFPEPARVFLFVLTAGKLLTLDSDRLVGAAGLERIGSQPAGKLLGSLLSGMLGLNDWLEYAARPNDFWIKERAPQGRFVLLAALCCLPKPEAWFRFDDFERALFDRVGAYFTVNYIQSPPSSYGKVPAVRLAELDAWRRQVRDTWERNDVRWLHLAFRTWLYAFGLVELSLAGDTVERFRLTDAGRVALGYEAPPKTPQTAAEPTSGWIVQPNFDVVVYLDSATVEQVAFLEQSAERVNLAQHTAQYRLTRTSVYDGLERGMDVDRLIAGLAAGSRLELPGNVVTEIRTWAMLRERIIMRRQTNLLEFPDAAALQSALKRGLAGQTVGERFLLLTGPPVQTRAAGIVPEVIDYADKSPRCLRVTEDGLITLAAVQHDLLIPGYLALWAERKSDTAWQLTRESVAGAIRRGRTLRELQALLQDRLPEPAPALLKVALRSWAGEKIAAGLGEPIVLQCAQPETLDALLASQALKPYLLGRIGPDAALVKSGSVSKVRKILDWAGLQTSTQIVKQRY